MGTKHEHILDYIRKLEVGDQISVRKIAKEIGVSEGTAYRGIKAAEVQGLVNTIERVGTVRIEKKKKKNFERLTFAEVINIVDGHVLGGRGGLYKTLHKFVIGAMEIEAMGKYIEAGSLLIVGNRDEVHRFSLQQGAAVLITGGFGASDEVIELADQLHLPIISSSYDTFTVASMINRAITDRLIKKEILLIEDILIPIEETHYLFSGATVWDWEELSRKTRHTRFPIIDSLYRLQGMITAKDVLGQAGDVKVDRVMIRNPITVVPRTSIASAAHTMVWEGIELLPVVDRNRQLVGIITRQDILKALQSMQRQPQIGETFDDLIFAHFSKYKEDGRTYFKGKVVPQMTNIYGTLSSGVLSSLMAEASRLTLQEIRKGNYVSTNMTTYFLKPVQIDRELIIKPTVIEIGRKFGKVDIEVDSHGEMVGKALLTAQIWEG